jgi:16S rRNA (guanine966-N2)-methyltransferase
VRIIAGEFRSRRLLPPESDTTRPITDRAKQSLFDILTPYLSGAVVYDCFAGTGSMGLESLSRGCRRALFFERDRSALQRLKQNIAALAVADCSEVISQDLFAWFAINPAAAATAEVVFFDPPYRFLRERAADVQQAMGAIARGHLSPGGLLVFRHDARDALACPALRQVELRDYGEMRIELLTPAGGGAA